MVRVAARSLGLLLALACTGWSWPAGVAGAVDAPGPDEATIGVATRENPESVETGIAIKKDRRTARNHPSLVYSIPVAGLSAAERMRVVASAYVSFCAYSDNGVTAGNLGTPCGGKTPRGQKYDVMAEMHVFAAPSKDATSSASTDYLGSGRAECNQAIHHCPIDAVFDPLITDPAMPYVNLDVSAWRTGGPPLVAHKPDLLELETDCNQHSGSISYENCHSTPANVPDPLEPRKLKTSKGWLAVIRFGSAYGDPTPAVPVPTQTSRIDHAVVGVNATNARQRPHPKPAVVTSFRYDDLSPGDIVEASAAAHVVGKNFDHSLNSWWVLGSRPSSTAARSGSAERYASASNGTNCLGSRSGLNSLKSGSCEIASVAAVAVPGGVPLPDPMYLNFVVSATDGHVKDARGRDTGQQKPPARPRPRPTATVSPVAAGTAFEVGCDPVGDQQPCVIPAS